MIKAPLICETHSEEIKYFCLAEACYFEPLCDICANEHKSVHSKLELMPTKKAYQLAESNLLKQETEIEKYLSPLTIRQNMLKIIDQQRQDL